MATREMIGGCTMISNFWGQQKRDGIYIYIYMHIYIYKHRYKYKHIYIYIASAAEKDELENILSRR